MYIATANLQLISIAMEYRSVKGMNGWGQLGILLVFFGAGFILAGIIQLAIAYQLVPSGLPMDKIGDAMIKPAPVNTSKIPNCAHPVIPFTLLYSIAMLISCKFAVAIYNE